jgi:hypothetical protein
MLHLKRFQKVRSGRSGFLYYTQDAGEIQCSVCAFPKGRAKKRGALLLFARLLGIIDKLQMGKITDGEEETGIHEI